MTLDPLTWTELFEGFWAPEQPENYEIIAVGEQYQAVAGVSPSPIGMFDTWEEARQAIEEHRNG